MSSDCARLVAASERAPEEMSSVLSGPSGTVHIKGSTEEAVGLGKRQKLNCRVAFSGTGRRSACAKLEKGISNSSSLVAGLVAEMEKVVVAEWKSEPCCEIPRWNFLRWGRVKETSLAWRMSSLEVVVVVFELMPLSLRFLVAGSASCEVRDLVVRWYWAMSWNKGVY